MALCATPDNPIPPGAETHALTASDGVRLRAARWIPQGARATVALLNGRTEFIEKYFETIADLTARELAVATLDWRGQGGSERQLGDRRKGHIDDFALYERDFAAFQRDVLADCPRPWIGLAHSMGGAILLRIAHAGRAPFNRIVLSAPMIAIHGHVEPRWERWLVEALDGVGLGGAYAPGAGGPRPYAFQPFEGNVLTSDPTRFARSAAVQRAHPALSLGGPTIGWTHAAFRQMRAFAEPDYPLAISVPALVIAASADRVVDTRSVERFASRLRAGSLITLDGARHEPMMEQDRYRELFFRAFDAFAPGDHKLNADLSSTFTLAPPQTGAPPATRPTLSVVVPTYREAANVPKLFERLASALDGLPWEMVVVDDDSSDGTYDVAFAIARRDPRLRCLRRVNRSGLAGAVIEGWLSSSADFVAVIDGDLQHDEAALPQMYAALERGEADLAIGTRVRDPAKPGGLSPARQKLSDLGKWFFGLVAGVEVSDPMSGFFMTRRETVARLAAKLSPDGFKILVDLVLSSRNALRVVETPYVFRPRAEGESKLSPLVGLDFLGLVAHHATGGVLPTRFVLFALIGGVGVVVHLAVLAALIGSGLAISFAMSQIVATIAAMASNFALNNEITYRNRRYRGLGKLGGFAIFAGLCGVGAIANVNVAEAIYHWDRGWGLAGFAGALIGVVWNYAASNTFVWRHRRQR